MYVYRGEDKTGICLLESAVDASWQEVRKEDIGVESTAAATLTLIKDERTVMSKQFKGSCSNLI